MLVGAIDTADHNIEQDAWMHMSAVLLEFGTEFGQTNKQPTSFKQRKKRDKFYEGYKTGKTQWPTSIDVVRI